MKTHKIDGKKKVEFKIIEVKNLMILGVGVYLEHNYLLQRMGNAFQYIVFKDGQFYQSYITMNPDQGKEDFTTPQIAEIALVLKNLMETTVETLIKAKKLSVKKKKK